jgi:DNA replication and repair protein RecF
LKLDKIWIKNFRNIKNLYYEANEKLNFFIGNNAQGKTSFLEAIYVLSNPNTFRIGNDSNLINYQADSYSVSSWHTFEARQINSDLCYNSVRKIFKINHKLTNYKNNDRLRVVLFTPDDLYLIKGSPVKRRLFIDYLLRQVSYEYSFNLDKYNSILKKRNILLKNNQANSKSFIILNELFIENSVKIIIQRINLINTIDELISNLFTQINNSHIPIKIKYALSFKIDSDKINSDILSKEMFKYLDQNIDNEIAKRKTLFGPHLDDLNFYLNNRSAKIYASQGQQRNLAISLKLAEVYVFKKIKNYYPLFLLDEVMAELDEERKQNLFNLLSKADFQSFLTSVSLDKINTLGSKISIFENGELKKKEL